MQLEPLYTIPLVYQLTDPADTGTYYVRSVMKDSRTGTTLGTTNLTSQGSGRYTGTMVAPQDPTGFGRHIDIVTSVYSNAGYTTYSDVYQKEINVYIVRKSAQSFGGTGGAEIDYEKIRKIFTEVVKKAIEGIDTSKTDLTPVYERFGALDKAVAGIEIPEPTEKTDLAPVLSAILKIVPTISKKIDSIKKPDPVDLTPVIDEVKKVSSEVLATKDSVVDSITQVVNEIEPKVSSGLDKISGQIIAKNTQLRESIGSILDNGIPVQKPKPQDERFAKLFPKI